MKKGDHVECMSLLKQQRFFAKIQSLQFTYVLIISTSVHLAPAFIKSGH